MTATPMPRYLTTLVVLCATIFATRAARAETRRVAVVVGQNSGGPAEATLHFAESDASKVADVLTEVGEVDPSLVFVVRGARRDTLRAAFERATAAIAGLRGRPEDRTMLLFYYSGHSDGDVLELDGDRLAGPELRAWLAATRADVRVAFIDGCRSGAMLEKKGGARAPAFDIKLADALDASGDVLVTSSAADEVALESKEIRGSFFTHHLVSGLRGAADASGDGRVTLAEAYEYAFAHTLAATMQTGMAQHPAYQYRISGQGDLVLATLGRPTATLELPEGFDRALVVLVKRDQVLAELTSDTTRRIAVRPGEYAVRAWRSGRTFAGRVQVVEGQTRVVAWSELASVSPSPVAAKGPQASDGADADDLMPEARAEYDGKFFQIGDEVLLTVSNNSVSTTESFAVYRGKYRAKVKEPEFYRTVGRQDLAESYEGRRAARIALVVTGLAVVVGSFTWMITRSGCGDDPGAPGFGRCVEDGWKPIAVASAGLVLGSGIALSALLIDEHPVEVDVARRLADEHNQELLRRLRTTRPKAPQPTGSSLVFAPFARPDGAGLGIMGRF